MYFTLTKKTLAVVLAAVVIFLILIGQLLNINAYGIDASTNAKRIMYINTLGVEANETPTEVKTIKIPQEFNDVYKKYNILQQEAGFDLLNYKGKSAELFTYPLTDDSETVVHLIVYKGDLIGGDIASLKIDGEMRSLKGKDE